MSDALASLRRLHAALVHGEPMLVEDRQLIAGGLACYFAERCASLDQAFGVDRLPGQRDARAAARLAERDDAIRDALARFNIGAERLSIEIGRYRASAWRRDRAAAVCPYAVEDLRSHLWRILMLRDSPISSRQIRDITRR